jgi:hypothetical protein
MLNQRRSWLGSSEKRPINEVEGSSLSASVSQVMRRSSPHSMIVHKMRTSIEIFAFCEPNDFRRPSLDTIVDGGITVLRFRRERRNDGGRHRGGGYVRLIVSGRLWICHRGEPARHRRVSPWRLLDRARGSSPRSAGVTPTPCRQAEPAGGGGRSTDWPNTPTVSALEQKTEISRRAEYVGALS